MSQNATYLIQIDQPLGDADATWFEGLTIYRVADAETLLLTPAIDQTALHGILATLRDLAIPLAAVCRVSSPAAGEETVRAR